MRSLLLATVLTAGLASSAESGGINLAWNDCGAFGSTSQTFACNTNSGIARLYASFVPASDLTQLVQAVATLQISTSQPVLSQWWSLGSGGCRVLALSTSSDFTTGPFNCSDPWANQAATAGFYDYQFGGDPTRARITAFATLPVDPATVTTSHEYYSFRFGLTFTKSTGTGSCAGCLDGICIVLQSVELDQSQGNPAFVLTNPLLSQSVTWQTGAPICPGATPSRASTWGSVKALYR